MKTMTVAARLSLGFASVILLLILVAAIGISRLAQLDEATRLIVQDRWVNAKLASDITQHSSQIAIALRNMLLNDNRADLNAQQERIMASRKAIGKAIETLQRQVTLPHGQEILGQVLAQRARYIAGQDQLMGLIELGETDAARQYLNQELRPILSDYQKSLSAFGTYQSELMAEAGQSASETYTQARNLSIAVVLISLAFAAGLGWWIIRSVTHPLGGEPEEAKAVVERIAEGDLTTEIQVKAGDTTSLVAATQRMQANLRRITSELQANAENVAASAQQLATTSTQVATATEEQSTAASAMAAAVEQMTVSINHVSESAREAHSATTETGTLSQTGNDIIQGMVSEMQAISTTVGDASENIRTMGEHSQKISGIVQVIKDVADQTNLLALNAAIEAARAGELGAGFAVVADEVRKLAERTATATTEIGQMIDSVQSSALAAVDSMQQTATRVGHGVDMAQQARNAMLGISDGAQHVVSSVNEISGALQEQSVASNDISANVEKIAQMSEENSAATRAAADTAKFLETLAAQSRQAVSCFRV